MLDLVFFVLLTVVVPMLINKTTEGHLHWLKREYLRPIWTVVFSMFSLYLLQKPAAQEFVLHLHQRWQGWAGYLVSAGAGAIVLMGYWWLTGLMLKPPPARQPAPQPQPTEAERRQALLERLRHEYILSHDNLSPGVLAGTEQPPAEWLNQRLAQLGETWTVAVAAKPHEAPITKTDSFATLVPIVPAWTNSPIPMNNNVQDPHHDYYRDLLMLAGRPDKPPEGSPPYANRGLEADNGVAFSVKLIQYYVFRSIYSLQRGSSGGIKWTRGVGVTPNPESANTTT